MVDELKRGNDRAAHLERLLAERLDQHAGGIPRRDRTAPAPLSFVQHSLWVLWKISGGATSENRPTGMRLRGPLDLEALELALSELLRRHEVLRTTFPEVDGSPVQVVHEARPVALEITDLSRLPESEQEREARAAATRLVVEPFALDAEPAFRPHLIRLAADHHLLVVALHHIVFDGWSERVFHHEVAKLYEACVAGAPDDCLPELPVQYADHAAWQQSRSSDEEMDDHLAFWMERLGDLPDDVELPADIAVPDAVDDGAVFTSLPEGLAAALKAFAREQGVTPFMVLLGALQILVSRLSRERDLIIGVATAGRDQPETEALIGCFINTLLVRSTFAGDPTFREVVGGARDSLLGAMAHADLPYSRVVSEFRPWGGPVQGPLYRVHFQMRNFPALPAVDSNGLEMEPFRVDDIIGGHDLAVRADDVGDTIHLELAFDHTRFSRETIERWGRCYLTMLEAAIADPGLVVWDLPLLDETDRHHVVFELNQPSRTAGTGPLPHERFEAFAAREPEAPAYIEGDRTFTYAELNSMVNAIAHALLERGVSREQRVAVYMSKGADVTAAILGILKSGAAYVPIDVTVSREWLASIVEDADPAVIVTSGALADECRRLGPAVVVVEEAIAQGSTANPGVAVASDDLAYVIYTSGSTGKPKGVMVEHRQLAEFIRNHSEMYDLGPGDRTVQFYAISFDGSISNFMSPLAVGSAVVLRDDEAMGTIERFLEWCSERSITHLLLPTSFFHELARAVVERSL
ncbi:MAG: condensation domain-containing protein, partial [Acidimicrobiia bacterium]